MSVNDLEPVRQACLATIAGYTHFADSGAFERAVTFFKPDGLWLRGGTPLKGREEIRKSLEGRKPGLIIRHIIGSSWVELKDGDTAEVVTTYTAYNGQGDAEPPKLPLVLGLPFSLGEWHDTLVRTPEGWRIAKRETRRLFQRPDSH